MAQDLSAQDSMTNDFHLQNLCVEQGDMCIFEEMVSYFTQHLKNTLKVSSMKVQIVGR